MSFNNEYVYFVHTDDMTEECETENEANKLVASLKGQGINAEMEKVHRADLEE